MPSLFIDGEWTTSAEEVFGPVLTVERFSTEEKAVRIRNDTDDGSGIGREPGPTGLDECREATHICRHTSPGPSRWFLR